MLVDISTPASTFECVDAAVVAHIAANPNDFTGKHLVVANNAGDPLKFMLCVWWEYCHQGKEKLQTPIFCKSPEHALKALLDRQA